MLAANDDKRLLLELFFDRYGKINNIQFILIYKQSIDRLELNRLEETANMLKKRRVEKAKKENEKLGRNSLCPCGSGKKYKRCCLIV